MTGETEVKGIIISAAANGEYGRRAKLITDKLGLITVFAQGAAKQNSRLIGTLRPMTCAVFRLQKGRGAYNLHGADVIDAFTELTADFENSVYAMYVLEAGEYFSAEGMPENEARALLNLMYVTLEALRAGRLKRELIMAVYRLRLLVLQGEYTTAPPYSEDEAAAVLWRDVIAAKLTRLYASDRFVSAAGRMAAGADAGIKGQAVEEQATAADTGTAYNAAEYGSAVQTFMENADRLFAKQVRHSFRSLSVLHHLQ